MTVIRLSSASAAGYYGIAPQGPCDEDRPPGDDILARLCVDWEAAAAAAPSRVVRFRFGHVLGDGGLLARLLPLYRWRLGGVLGSGRQGLPWVHVHDVVEAILWALHRPIEGPFNLAAPLHVDYAAFNRAVADRLEVFARWRIPGFALRLVAGRIAPHLLGGQHLPSAHLQATGFEFGFSRLDDAIADLLPEGGGV